MTSRVWNAASEMLWKEYMANCFAKREQFGKMEDGLRFETVQPTESFKLCLRDYEKVSRVTHPSRHGQFYILYGLFGSGKSQTLLSIARGTSMRHPSRSIFVNVGVPCADGNAYMKELCKTLSFNGRSIDLAWNLAECAVNQLMAQKFGDMTQCCSESAIVEQGKLIQIAPPVELEDPVNLFDKMPVIVLDNVKFPCTEEDNLADRDKHGDFFQFIGGLYEAAHGKRVVVFLGVSNLYLAAKMSILNGGTKIRPATVSQSQRIHIRRIHRKKR